MERKNVYVPSKKPLLKRDDKPLATISPGVIVGEFVYVSDQQPFDHISGELIKGGIQLQTRPRVENVTSTNILI